MSAAYGDIILDEGLDPRFKLTVIISIALHLAVILFGFILLPGLTSGRALLPPVYTVRLVSLPPMAAPAAAPKKAAAKPASKPAFIPPKQKAELIPLGPVKEGPKKKTEIKKIKKAPPKSKPVRRVDSSRDLEKALARVKTKIQKKQQASDRIDSAISRLAKKSGPGGGTTTAYGLQGTGPRSELDVKLGEWLIVIHNVINANWNMPPAGLLRKKGPLEAVYIIQISQSGTIVRGWFERKSGDKYFDQSAEKAVARSNPLPPLPENFKGQNFEVGLRFTPTGLTNNE
ncbi:MAG: TonB C-terminal domain-containing protein [Deltaproteobacteria bacterium]|nr:TonB C-terminal domain-containing protein [Deltaproteobacteria bacterium]MBW2053077.1 TonB C-terminal domain-containing protein [Deltaproteobacteria bacterium]MBW2141625.1 TonB C-terminal domain-containing protein [Deltaproteobacteria bacterium]MBW2321903.1 TonB C-terminal domain-containing protein [Deltaproteobacteria bacterium]